MLQPEHKRGDKVWQQDPTTGKLELYLVVHVQARLTPFRKKGQDTTVIGYTYGLIRARVRKGHRRGAWLRVVARS